jgi:hypothetical protein
MRRLIRNAALFVLAFVPNAAQADVTFDVSVSVHNIAAQANVVVVECLICSTDCERITNPAQVIGQGSGRQAFRPGQAHEFNGRIPVTVRAARGNEASATDYLCTLQFTQTPGSAAVAAGAPGGPAWAQPQPGTPFVNKLRGKLPRTASTTIPQPPPPPPQPQGRCESFQVGTWPNCHCPRGLTGPRCENVDVR